MREIEGRDGRLSHVGVELAWEAAEPGLDGVDPLADDGEVTALHDLFREPQLFVRDARVGVDDGEGCRDVRPADHVGAELLQRFVGVERFVRGVAVEERRRLVGHDLFEYGANALALGEPLTADPGG